MMDRLSILFKTASLVLILTVLSLSVSIFLSLFVSLVLLPPYLCLFISLSLPSLLFTLSPALQISSKTIVNIYCVLTISPVSLCFLTTLSSSAFHYLFYSSFSRVLYSILFVLRGTHGRIRFRWNCCAHIPCPGWVQFLETLHKYSVFKHEE